MNAKHGIVQSLTAVAVAAVAWAIVPIAGAAPTDIATSPLITPGTSNVKPNLFFILDNSGSMNWDYLPDSVVDDRYCKGTATGTNEYCCRTPAGAYITSSFTTSTCLPQNSSGTNLDGNGNTNLRGMPPFHSPDFNSIYYNPEITYTPPQDDKHVSKPSYSGSGAVPWNGYNTSSATVALMTEFPDVEWCTDSSYTDCLRNDNYLLPGTVGGKDYSTMRAVRATGALKPYATGTVLAPATTTRDVGPYYYLMVPGEYCSTNKLTDCVAQTAPTTAYKYPATLRWCTSPALRNCQALRSVNYTYPRYPTVRVQSTSTLSLTCNSCSSTSVSGITVNGQQIMKGTATGSTTPSILAGRIVTQINSCTAAKSGNCSIAGYSAASYNNEVVITAPATQCAGTWTPAVTKSGSMSISSSAFTGTCATSVSSVVPGSFMRVDIVPGQSYGNIVVGGEVIVNRSKRTDCTGGNCTYAQELANFANWFAYYRSRMQMMKSSVSLAFQGVDDRFRVGYFTINSSSSNLVNIKNFDDAQRTTWYAKLFGAVPDGSTPLRQALANAGRIFAGKEAITAATDPVQYSCQKNFAILSTDGYWNGSNGTKINGSTAIANEDGGLTRPEKDGRNESGTLADVAAYYYNTDLRDSTLNNCIGALGSSVCVNDVPTSTTDPKDTQHMTTYTIGLGVDGVMKYRSNYKKSATADQTPDDFEAVSSGTAANPAAGICPWQASGACDWPLTNPTGAEGPERVDDLWHAAVNGHGTYYSARSPVELDAGLRDVLLSLNTKGGAAAAAATSNPNMTTGDNFVFTSSYTTAKWFGELVSQNMNISSGAIESDNWNATTALDGTAFASRKIYTFDWTGSGRKLFDWDSLEEGTLGQCNPPLSERGCFSSPYIASSLAQYCTIGSICLTATQKTAASGMPLVDFLRGSREHERTLDAKPTEWYRDRVHVLGDIVSSEATYVGKYLFDYGTENGYPAKDSPRANPTVYVAANDGMLHAFNATTNGGDERWAYVPSMVLRNMHKLADFEYSDKHIYLVDGTPVVGDIQTGGGWKTILVGGLGFGGAGYYALDITDQTNPTVLWEFRAGQVQVNGTTQNCTAATAPRHNKVGKVTAACDLGYSVGNPIIAKVNGTWAVMVTSGYNNTAGGDGEGYLYILNAETGAMIGNPVSTGEGNTTTPSGLGRINAWADNAMQDNTAKYVYGGDLLGNMWAFDLTSGTPTKKRLINVSDKKPITAKPELGEVVLNNGTKKRIVLFPTGKLIGNTDLTDTNKQSFYGIWDKDGGSAPTTLVVSNPSAGGEGRTGSVIPSVFDDDANLGWQLNFPDQGERGNTDPSLAFGTLVFTTNRPTSPDACNPSGFESWIYAVDYRSGGVVQQPGGPNTFLAKNYHGASTRPNLVVLPSGRLIAVTRVSGTGDSGSSGGRTEIFDPPTGTESSPARRISWRELTN